MGFQPRAVVPVRNRSDDGSVSLLDVLKDEAALFESWKTNDAGLPAVLDALNNIDSETLKTVLNTPHKSYTGMSSVYLHPAKTCWGANDNGTWHTNRICCMLLIGTPRFTRDGRCAPAPHASLRSGHPQREQRWGAPPRSRTK